MCPQNFVTRKLKFVMGLTKSNFVKAFILKSINYQLNGRSGTFTNDFAILDTAIINIKFVKKENSIFQHHYSALINLTSSKP